MKKYILSLLIGTALLSSCLDVDIVDRVEKEDGFFKTEDHALAAINGVYSTLYAFAYHKTNWAIILPTYEDAYVLYRKRCTCHCFQQYTQCWFRSSC